MTSAGQIVDAGGADPGGQRLLNDAGQVAFRAELADGRDGVYLWTPPVIVPEISAVALEGNDAVIRVPSEAGKNCQLLRRGGLEIGDWEGEGDAVEGTGDEVELRHPEATTGFDQQFYQVEVSDP